VVRRIEYSLSSYLSRVVALRFLLVGVIEKGNPPTKGSDCPFSGTSSVCTVETASQNTVLAVLAGQPDQIKIKYPLLAHIMSYQHGRRVRTLV
jgi:hypothetical protein